MRAVHTHKKAGTSEIDLISRLRLRVSGRVQGVGFRPFIYRLATELNLTGWVRNSPSGVEVELEGSEDGLQEFTDRLPREKPILSNIDEMELTRHKLVGYSEFIVRESINSGNIEAVILPDIATCEECRQDIFDPTLPLSVYELHQLRTALLYCRIASL